MSRIKNRIFLLTTLFFIICCICEYLQFRKGIFVINLIAVISFFIIFLKNKKTKAWSIYLFWVFFIVSGLTVSLYNHAAYGEVTIILKLLGYIMLLIYAYSKQKKNKIKSLDFLVYAIVFVINLYVVFEVVKMISSSISASHMIVLFSIYGIVHILLYMNAFRYRLQYDSRSKYFLVFAAFLTSAEVFGIFGYFLDYKFMIYFKYFFYMFGLCYGVIAFIFKNRRRNIQNLIKPRMFNI